MLRDEKIKQMYRKWFLSDIDLINQLWKLYYKKSIDPEYAVNIKF